MKFHIVSPTYNSEKYLRQTIESVLTQEGDFEIEYIIADGLSKDATVRIAQEYISKLERGEIKPKCASISMSCFSEKDRGMYDAINKGFARLAQNDADGGKNNRAGDTIMAWINGDDHYLPGAFKAVVETCGEYPHIEWLKGMTRFIGANGKKTKESICNIFNRSWIARGIYGRNAFFINQESVFWKRSLWEKIGKDGVEKIPTDLINAGDYWLWINFAAQSPLFSMKKEVAVFRYLDDSLTNRSGNNYRLEQARISPAARDFLENKIKTFFWVRGKIMKRVPAGSRLAQWAELPFRLAYPLLFKNTQKEYIDFTADGKPVIKTTHSYSL